MPFAQVYFNDKEFEEISIYCLVRTPKWSKQKLLKKAVLYYVRNKPREDIIKPEQGVENE